MSDRYWDECEGRQIVRSLFVIVTPDVLADLHATEPFVDWHAAGYRVSEPIGVGDEQHDYVYGRDSLLFTQRMRQKIMDNFSWPAEQWEKRDGW